MKCWRYLYQTFNCTRLASRLSLPTFTMFMSLLVMEKKKRNWFLLFGMGWLPLLSKYHCFNGFLPLNMSENKCLSQLAARLTFAKHVRRKRFDLSDLDLWPKVMYLAKTFFTIARPTYPENLKSFGQFYQKLWNKFNFG